MSGRGWSAVEGVPDPTGSDTVAAELVEGDDMTDDDWGLGAKLRPRDWYLHGHCTRCGIELYRVGVSTYGADGSDADQHAVAIVCSPSRGNLLTGSDPDREPLSNPLGVDGGDLELFD
jgi:hypothetical protein